MPVTLAEAEQAGRARQLRDGHALSFRGFASALDAEGLPPKDGGRWHPETVRRMLANPTDRVPTLRRRWIEAAAWSPTTEPQQPRWRRTASRGLRRAAQADRVAHPSTVASRPIPAAVVLVPEGPYRALAEHEKQQAYPEAVDQPQADFAALQTVGSLPSHMAGSINVAENPSPGP